MKTIELLIHNYSIYFIFDCWPLGHHDFNPAIKCQDISELRSCKKWAIAGMLKIWDQENLGNLLCKQVHVVV